MLGSILLFVPKNKNKTEIVVCDKSPLRREGKYLGDVAWGKLRRFPIQEFKERGMEIVLGSLGEYGARDSSDRGEYDSLDKRERQKLDYNHHQVLIWNKDECQIVVQDCRRRESQIPLRLEADSKELYTAVTRVLGLR